ncbi:hypothetical protein F4604DRAFT_1916501 [Suillus subluteus]|nr:hypothetical protein F4604DRAFT_1916501 [Suillus subluteus]
MVKLAHEEHPFAGFLGRRFVVIGYIAMHGQVSALYCDECVVEERPWLQVLRIVGVLTVPNHMDISQEHPLFEVMPGDSEFLIKTPYGRRNILGKTDRMWFLAQLLQASIPFNPPLFPQGILPSALPPFEDHFATHDALYHAVDEPTASSTRLTITDQPPPPAPLTTTGDASLLDTILSPNSRASFNMEATTMMHFLDSTSDLGQPGPSGTSDEVVPGELAPINAIPVLHPDLKWKPSDPLWKQLEKKEKTKILRWLGQEICCWYCVIALTKALILGSLWVGMYGNPFKISDAVYRRAVTISFVTALQIDGKSYTDLMEQPLILRSGKTKKSIGWRIIRTHVHYFSSLLLLTPDVSEQLLSLFDNTRSELRKVVKGAMSPITGFCATTGDVMETIIERFLKPLNSGHMPTVQAALSELVVQQLFKELFWAALFAPVKGLADGKRPGRIADLFPEELCASAGCVAQDTVGNLATLVYHAMVLLIREGEIKHSVAAYKKHKSMNEVITSVLAPMYANPDKFPDFTESVMSNQFMDAYIGLTANQKLQTELYILSYLLKDRVCPDDLWQLVGERSIEAKQEETLCRHQSICHSGDGGRHAAVEQFLVEERIKRCNMEVSLYSQAIGMLEQLRMRHFGASRPPTVTQQERFISAIFDRIGPSLPLLSTWITSDIQEAFYDAFRTELCMQAELMTKSIATRRSNAYLRNLGLDLLILQAKMRRAKAEMQIYMLAIQNTYVFEPSDSSSQTSSDQTIPQPPLREEMNCYDEDIDDNIDDCDDVTDACGDTTDHYYDDGTDDDDSEVH